MAFLTKPKKEEIKKLVADVYENGSGTKHLENKQWGDKGHLIISIYGKSESWLVVEFGECNKKKKYTTEKYTWVDKRYAKKYIIQDVTNDMMTWLYSKDVEEGDCFDLDINQGTRECEVVKVGRTRARINYEMPNAGMMGGFINVFNMFGRKLYRFGLHGKHSHQIRNHK